MASSRTVPKAVLRWIRAYTTSWDSTQLEEVSLAKSLILSTVSHELKTPLTSIISQVYLLLTRRERVGPLNERQEGHLETIQRNSLRLKALIDDLLEISRIESGSLELTYHQGA